MKRSLAVLLLVCAAGCGKHDAPPPTVVYSEHEGHSHERDKMMLADFGPHHAALTAHLSSKTGHELDVFIETGDEKHSPVPLNLESFTATAKTADGKERELKFEPTEMDERPGDPPGQCSHFVAKAPWLKPDAPLDVSAKLEWAGKVREVKWANFAPSKFAHHVE
jgi:hypothetical protein